MRYTWGSAQGERSTTRNGRAMQVFTYHRAGISSVLVVVEGKPFEEALFAKDAIICVSWPLALSLPDGEGRCSLATF